MKSPDKILSGIRILCVDDCPDVLEFLCFFLTENGADITACASAEEAIATLTNERFDILISDLQMPPGLDGYDLAHELRGMENENLLRKPTPAIMISGSAMQPSRKRRFADFQVYMPKPFNPTRLIHVVERLNEADVAAVKLGSLDGWEAQQATEAAVVATKVAKTATAAAVEATVTAEVATHAAFDATESAAKAKATAAKAEMDASAASASAPPSNDESSIVQTNPTHTYPKRKTIKQRSSLSPPGEFPVLGSND